MKSKKVIGLTGSISTGKSTAAQILRELGYEVIDADKITHDLMQIGGANYKALVDYFGRGILDDKESINRAKLGAIVFSDKEKLKVLNKLTHRNIFHTIRERINDSAQNLIFVEIPLLVELLLEDKLDISLDEIWLVYVDSKKQLERLMIRNGLSEDEAKKRINSQLSVDVKKEHADFVLYNDRDLDYLKEQIIERLDYYNEDIS